MAVVGVRQCKRCSGDMNSRLSSQIFNDMMTDIIRGSYPTGSRLPPERELAVKYNASRFAIREAIAMLTQGGFVETHPQSGTYVKDFQREGSLDTLVRVLRVRRTIDRQTIESLLKFRYMTETQAAGEAAVRIRPDDVEYLERNLARKKENLEDIAVLAECDFDFHYFIITVSGNIINQMIFKSIGPIYSFFTEFFYSLKGAPETSLRLNRKLVNALADKDRDGSIEAMSDILKYGEKKVYDAIRGREGEIVL